MSETILLVEDNEYIMDINAETLEMEDYNVLKAKNVKEGREIIQEHGNEIDLIVLDIMLPDGSGLDLCKEIKGNTQIPVLFLSALSENDDIIQGLKSGGDDYLAKPYDLGVLLARIKARLRSVNEFKRFVSFNDLKIDTISMIAYCKDKELELTQKEYSLMILLITNPEKKFMKEELYETIWGTSIGDDARAFHTMLSRLNKKLSEANLQIVRSSDGYQLKQEEGE